MLRTFNLNSRQDITANEVAFAGSILERADLSHHFDSDNYLTLMDKIPVILVNPETLQKSEEYIETSHSGNPATETLGVFTKVSVLGEQAPAILISPERIREYTSAIDYPIILAKVIIHEFAHAKLAMHPAANYGNKDEFYYWMEEPFANYLTLEAFGRNFGLNSKEYQTAHDFINQQPDNYRLGLDFLATEFYGYWIWRNQKNRIKNMHSEKNAWLNYVKQHVGNCDSASLESLFSNLHMRKKYSTPAPF